MKKTTVIVATLMMVTMAMTTISAGVGATFVGDVVIDSSGNVVPSEAPISVKGIEYTLTDDIHGTITIEKSGITLDGADYTLMGSGSGHGISLSGLTGVTIKNIEVNNFGYGITVINCDTCTIKENTVSDTYDAGIYLSDSNGNTVKDNKVSDSVWEGIWLEGSSNNVIKDNELWNSGEAGIFLWYSSNNNIIKDNYAHDNGAPLYGAGIMLYFSSNDNLIHENDLSDGNTIGIAITTSDANTITENTIWHNDIGGIFVYAGSSGNTISKNSIRFNYQSGFCGIRIWQSGDNTISQNTITHNYRGILVFKNPLGTSNLIEGNTIRDNAKGIQLSYFSYDNQIHHNNFINNDIQAIDYGIDNQWDDGTEGNYWKDYKGKDLDHDGVGDTDLPHQGVDWCPLMNPWEP
jgi:parallel beta-helix repeat protein